MNEKQFHHTMKIIDSRKLPTSEVSFFVRRIRVLKDGGKLITHEIPASDSPVPDVYRLKRRRIYKPKEKKKKESEAWLKKINKILDEG
jgi:hypothetical protein